MQFIHRNVVIKDISSRFTPDFCNFSITFSHYSSVTAANLVILQQLAKQIAFSDFHLQCSAELKIKRMLQLLGETRAVYGILSYKVTLFPNMGLVSTRKMYT